MPDVKPLTPEIVLVRDTVKAWERLRLVYNVVLLIPGLLIAAQLVRGEFPVGPFPRSYPDLVFQCVVVGVLANVFFCLGPYAELVVTAFGFPLTAKRIRYFLFGIGLLISLGVMGLTALFIELHVGFSTMS